MKATLRRIVPKSLWAAARRIKRNAEFRRLKAESAPITKERLVADFEGLGIERGDVVFVHSSLRSLGFVDGGPDAVIDALQAAVGPEGTLLFPTFTITGGMKETLESGESVFDPQTSPSTVGKITNAFRARPGVFRSHHPTHSVAAWGRLAETLTKTHLEEGTNFGAGSPFAKLLDVGGKIMGLGISYGPVTYYHVYEDLHPEKFPDVYLREPYRARIVVGDGRREVIVKCHDPEFHRRRIDKTPEIESFFASYFESEGVAHRGPVGHSTSWWLYAKDMIACLEKLYDRGITIYRTPNLKD